MKFNFHSADYAAFLFNIEFVDFWNILQEYTYNDWRRKSVNPSRIQRKQLLRAASE